MGSVSASEETRVGARMEGSTPIVCWFEEVNKDSVALVGGKCSSLGELINAGVRVPPGFALTTHGYAQFMRDAGIQSEVNALLKQFGEMQKMMKGLGGGLLGGSRKKAKKGKKGGRVTPKGGPPPAGLPSGGSGAGSAKTPFRLPGI